MILLPKYHGETAVFGLGRSGLSVVRALVAAGNNVSAWDQNSAQRAAAEQAGAQIRDLETEFGSASPLGVEPRRTAHPPAAACGREGGASHARASDG
jgi:threonine dehydrogenase-like Zn-dependent dehydrogenase